MVKDYNDIPSQTSGSVIQINQDSPYLDENLKLNQWSKTINKIPKDLNKKLPKVEQKTNEPKKLNIKTSKPKWAK